MVNRILSLADLTTVLATRRAGGERVVLTNGCFDIVHAGHVDYLERARALGDILVLALNSDASVRALKGPSRPVNSQDDRALVASALRSVDFVTVFESLRATDVISELRPDIYAKGGDYTLETLDPDEAAALRAAGSRVEILPLVPGRSTTAILARSAAA